MRVLSVSVAAGALLCSLMLSRAELANGIMAVVHDSVVTYGEVDAHTDAPYLYRRYGAHPEVFQQELEKVRKENLDLLIDRQLILHEFATAGYSLPESVVDEMVDKTIHEKFADRRTWAKTLQAEGESFEKYRQDLRDRAIIDGLISKNISQSILISPHKVEVYYQQHHDDYKVEAQVKLRRINLPQSSDTNAPSPEKMAEEIDAKLNTGATFSEMQSLYSQNKQEGQWYDMPNGLLKPLADIVVSLKPGQHSGVICRSIGENDYWVCQYTNGHPVLGRHYKVDPATLRASLALEQKFDANCAPTNLPPAQEYYIVLLEDLRAGHYKPLSEVRDKIEDELTLEETARLKKIWLDKLRKKTFVRIFPGG